MSHERSRTYERDGRYYNVSGVTGEDLAGPFDTEELAVTDAKAASSRGGYNPMPDFNELNNILFPEQDEERKRKLAEVEAAEAARQAAMDEGSRRLLEKGGGIGFDPARQKYEVEREIAIQGPQAAREYLKAQEIEKDAERARALALRKSEAEAGKEEAELEKLLAENAGVAAGEPVTTADKVDMVKVLKDPAARDVLTGYPNVKQEVEEVLGGKPTPAADPIRQTAEGVYTNLPPVTPQPDQVEQLFTPAPDIPAPAAVGAEPDPTETPAPAQVTAQPTPFETIEAETERRIREKKATEVRIKNAAKLKDQLEVSKALTGPLMAMVTPLWGDLQTPTLGSSKSVIAGGLKRAGAYGSWNAHALAQTEGFGETLSRYRTQGLAAATALAKMAGEQRITDADARRFLALLPDAGGLLFDAPDTSRVALAKQLVLQKMMVELQKSVNSNSALSYSRFLTKAEDDLKDMLDQMNENPYMLAAKDTKPGDRAIGDSPEAIMEWVREDPKRRMAEGVRLMRTRFSGEVELP